MPFNLLLFPLVGGYYFLVRSRISSFWQQRVERQRLLFNSVIIGAGLLLVSFLFTLLCVDILPSDFIQKISKTSPLDLPFFWTTVGSFILGILLAEISNVVVKRDNAIRWAIRRIGNDLEVLFLRSWSEPQLIQLTLKSNKVYVGWVKSLPIPNHSNYVSILPAFSGYRDGTTKVLYLNTQYLDIYSTYVQDGVVDIHSLTTQIVKIEEIVSASTFDSDMWDRFHQVQNEDMV